VKLGYRKELEAIADAAERRAAFDKMVRRLRPRKALSTTYRCSADFLCHAGALGASAVATSSESADRSTSSTSK